MSFDRSKRQQRNFIKYFLFGNLESISTFLTEVFLFSLEVSIVSTGVHPLINVTL